jgi:hypothetical protein
MSEEFRGACRERMKNFKHTDEAKNKISKANSGRKWDEDSKKRASVAQKERYKNGNNSLANLTPEQRKEAVKKANETNKKNGTGVWAVSEEERRERAKKNYHKTLGLMWKCLVTGKIANAGSLTNYQRARGIDTSQRVKI